MKKNKIKVVELFAGVGGFRLGLEKLKITNEEKGKKYILDNNSDYEVIWSNQWEPSTKIQHASMVYENVFGNQNHSNEDINEIVSENIEKIPDHDLLVGGFPCQDYSVATTLKNSKGLIGKKGVLWWSINEILSRKTNKPKYLLFENVDRLLKSPAKQRGRDFAVMLKSLDDLGYAVEWRVVNAAEYGMPQRRRRVFFIGYHKSTHLFMKIIESKKMDWLTKEGTIANAFPVTAINGIQEVKIKGNFVKISSTFNINGKKTPFQNTGLLINGKVYTTKTEPDYNGEKSKLKKYLQNGKVAEEFYIKDVKLKSPKTVYKKDGKKEIITTEKEMWEYLKGPKKEKRITQDGYEYNYSEGGMIYPDALDNASRTIITGEGGKSPSRFKHVIKSNKGLRRLTPVELERLNMFPDDHTKLDGITDTKRAFFMGNALVVGVIERIGKELSRKINELQLR